MDAIALGPVVLPIGPIIILLSVAAALLALRGIHGDERAKVEQALWWASGSGLLAARIAYVVLHSEAYRADPLAALRIWEDGFVWSIGALVAIIVASERAHRRGFRMHRLAAPVTIAIITWALASTAAEVAAPPTEVRLPANVALTDLSGQTVHLTAFVGRPTVVNLWATWCPPCRREMPVLAAAQRSHPEVNFVFANQGETPARVNAYLASAGLDIRNVLLDDGGGFRGFAASGLPTTLFFDAAGRLQTRHMGALSAARLADYLDVLGGRTAPSSSAMRTVRVAAPLRTAFETVQPPAAFLEARVRRASTLRLKRAA